MRVHANRKAQRREGREGEKLAEVDVPDSVVDQRRFGMAMTVAGVLLGWWSNTSGVSGMAHYQALSHEELLSELASTNDGVLSTSIMGGLFVVMGIVLTVDVLTRFFRALWHRIEPPGEATSIPVRRQPHLSWGKRPAVAVLPFRDQGGDTTQAYFSDGISEDIIRSLSRSHGLYVIA